MSKFKTKARTIELLGRKQIRDSVTALAELMKNSYDADADWVRAYFNSDRDNIILVDNGIGMSQVDIEEKWLVLGTPSKNTKKRVSAKGRPYMGAKGIGRLAAASLGRHYIMITKTESSSYNIVYLFWDLFEDTTVSLDEIEIPTCYDVDKNTIITSFSSIVEKLVTVQLQNVDVYAEAVFNPITKALFEQSVLKAKSNAENIIRYLGLIEKKGTLLFISDLRDDWNSILVQDNSKISDDITSEKNYKRLANFVSTLNSAYKKQEKCNNDFVEIFKNGNIMNFHDDYNEDDFKIFDIKFEGVIEEGIFKGELFAKNTNQDALKKANDVLKNGIDVSGGIENFKEYDCGPIRVKICHVEGEQTNSSLSPEMFKQIRDKIDVLGGIGIYRDGVRVLPYGEPENDYLEIERRRTNKAGVYVFSHRNIFGRIDISAAENPQLEDKSSREGFIENNYYHYFINTLKNLLIKIAMDFLSNAHKSSFNIRTYMVEHYKLEREKRKNQEEYEKREKEQFRIAVKELKLHLDDAKIKLSRSDDIEQDLNRLINSIQQLKGLELLKNFLPLRQELDAIDYRISDIKLSCSVSMPERFIADLIRSEPKLYENVLAFNNEVQKVYATLKSLYFDADKVFSLKETEFESVLEERRSLEKKIEVLNHKLHSISCFVNDVYGKIIERQQKLCDETERSFESFKALIMTDFGKQHCLSKVESIGEKIKSLDFDAFSDTKFEELNKEIEALKIEIEASIDHIYDEFGVTVENNTAIIQKINQLLKNRDMLSHDDKLIGSLKAQNLVLKEEVDLYEDLANFGMASEILNHEFNQFYTKANDAIIQLGTYLFDNNSKYWLRQIQIAFDAIYSRHSMLSPMYKIKSERITNHSLCEIVNGTLKLFDHTFKTENITVKVDIPDDVQVEVLPSHLYPALSNIISNSIYWLTGKNDKKVYLHYELSEHALYIEDNGKGIQANNKNDIFNPFYSLKPNGRGLGLTITKRVLQKDGHDISVVETSNVKLLDGACFKIIFKRKDENND